MKALTRSQEEHARGLQELIDRNGQYKDTLIVSQAEVGKQTATERKGYVERLQAAATYYRALSEQISRADMERNGPTATVSPEALDAARKASAYRTALQQLEASNRQREASETAHAERLKTIKDQELQSIKAQLAAQLTAYEQANKGIEQAKKRREDIEKEFANLSRDMTGSSAKGNDWGALQDAKLAARNALQARDTATAIEQARRAGEILRQMQQAGENTYGFKGIADELGQIASEAARLDEPDAPAGIEVQGVQGPHDAGQGLPGVHAGLEVGNVQVRVDVHRAAGELDLPAGRAKDLFRRQGLLAVTVNFQGGSPEGYSKGQPWLNSAFEPDGAMRPAYQERIKKILDQADRLGMVVIVGYFYFGQDERLTDEAAVIKAVDNATLWLLKGGWRNVLVEITAAGQIKSRAYYANSLTVQVVENYGQVRVKLSETGQPLAN